MVVDAGGSERTVVMSSEGLGDARYYIDDEIVAEGFEPPADWSEAYYLLDFRVELAPGAYEIVSLEIDDPEWGSDVPILTGRPIVTVEASGCTYLGVLYFNLYRLAPGTLEQQQAVAAEAAGELGVEIFMTFLLAGSLFGESAGAFIEEEGPPDWATGCTVHEAEFPG